jgi:hypothetical protein
LNTVSTNNATIDVTPTVITSNTPEVTVEISVPINDNSWVPPLFFENKNLVNSMTLQRERDSTTSVP